MIKLIALDVEYPIPARAIIFESNLAGQLQQLLLGKLLQQARVEVVRNVRRSVNHCVGELNYQKLPRIEWRQLVTAKGP